MKLQVLQEDFAKALTLVSRFVSTRATLPVLQNIVLKTEGQKVLLQATNLESSITHPIGANIEESGIVSLPSKTLTELLTSFPKGQVTLSTTGETVHISSSGFSGALAGMAANDFPLVPEQLGSGSFSLPSNEISSVLDSVLFAVSKDESRPILTGVLFSFEEHTLTIVGSDGFRLSIVTLPLSESYPTFRMVVPFSFLSEIRRIFSTVDRVFIEPKADENQVLFGLGDIVFLSRVIAGEFPDFRKILPQQYHVRASVDKHALVQALRIAGVFARESANIVSLSFSDGQIELSSESARSGNQKTTIDAKIDGGALKVMFNYRFIEEFLSSTTSDTIFIDMVDAYGPVLFSDPAQKFLTHIIMPVKL